MEVYSSAYVLLRVLHRLENVFTEFSRDVEDLMKSKNEGITETGDQNYAVD